MRVQILSMDDIHGLMLRGSCMASIADPFYQDVEQEQNALSCMMTIKSHRYMDHRLSRS